MVSALLFAIKSSIPIGVFVFLYWLLLRDEKNFRLNRLFLLSGLLLTFLFPVLQFSFREIVPEISTAIELPTLDFSAESVEQNITGNYSTIKILSIIYILGTIVFSLRFLFRLLQILFLTLRHRGVKMNGFQTVYVNGNQMPFTFFNILFLPKNQQGGRPDHVVLEHEWVHYTQMHSIDNIIIELAKIFQWFNPAIWMYKTMLQSVHEYEADKMVLKRGYNKFDYQKLMVETSTGLKVAGISSHFNATLLKKRITMMGNYKTNKFSGIKYVLVLIFFAIGLLLVAPGSISTAQNEPNDLVYAEVDVMPEYPGGLMEFRKFVAQNLRYPEDAKKAGVEGKVYINFVIDVNGEIIDINATRTDIDGRNNENTVVVVGEDGSSNSMHVLTVDEKNAMAMFEKEAIRVVSLADEFKPGENDGQKVKVQYTFPITFALK